MIEVSFGRTLNIHDKLILSIPMEMELIEGPVILDLNEISRLELIIFVFLVPLYASLHEIESVALLIPKAVPLHLTGQAHAQVHSVRFLEDLEFPASLERGSFVQPPAPENADFATERGMNPSGDAFADVDVGVVVGARPVRGRRVEYACVLAGLGAWVEGGLAHLAHGHLQTDAEQIHRLGGLLNFGTGLHEHFLHPLDLADGAINLVADPGVHFGFLHLATVELLQSPLELADDVLGVGVTVPHFEGGGRHLQVLVCVRIDLLLEQIEPSRSLDFKFVQAPIDFRPHF